MEDLLMCVLVHILAPNQAISEGSQGRRDLLQRWSLWNSHYNSLTFILIDFLKSSVVSPCWKNSMLKRPDFSVVRLWLSRRICCRGVLGAKDRNGLDLSQRYRGRMFLRWLRSLASALYYRVREGWRGTFRSPVSASWSGEDLSLLNRELRAAFRGNKTLQQL